ncbi:16S rRNA (cytidine(1402)-2'-O)-methyltransferase [Halalkalibacillus sediminis]|uniref:Ribosomal RNA small subunit methyltransferase I n=1 Tax=Halalkalibacillus sediminis TaxID=2018042 RepID=A0A2I0QT08_9BACI|nr:16S rRNA (cytidine(1402)-2'-O)-methyltransferase [Halalkalibacillus sediminis]PKR77485.1 16S rRNA (cytidine(1402)-2'-O)-methyltransferase [Halalkalibacillus sediminis]
MVHIQKSFEGQQAKLYIVPTPIGNLEDMTFRSVDTLKMVDLIACEDTRQSKKLMNHFEIETALVSYHEHNKFAREEELITKLKNGNNIAIVSDAGMPMISDPGYEMVRRAREEEIDVVVLPGANAALTALVGSGLPAYSFTFYGFLPRKKKELKEVLNSLKDQKQTMIFYESPYRMKQTLEIMKGVYPADRGVTVARELTKKFEEYINGTVEEVSEYFQSKKAETRGEFCLIVEGGEGQEVTETSWWEGLSIIEHVEQHIEQGLSAKDAIKQTSQERNMPKREVYQEYHQ